MDTCQISDKTKKDLRAPTRHFLWYAIQQGLVPESIDDATVMRFLIEEIPASNSGSTGRTLRCVKYATEYLKNNGNHNIHRDYTLLKLKNDHRRIVPAYSEDEICSIAGAMDTDDALRKRDRAIVLTRYLKFLGYEDSNKCDAPIPGRGSTADDFRMAGALQYRDNEILCKSYR